MQLKNLDRIRAHGTVIIWLMPGHPIGEVHRKGTLGAPYAIRDYPAEEGLRRNKLVDDILQVHSSKMLKEECRVCLSE